MGGNVYNVRMSTRTPKIRINLELSPAEERAMKQLIEAGYAFPSNTKIGVVRKMLRDTWEVQFPDTPFPSGREKDRP